MSNRKHFQRSERYETGEGCSCNIWWAPIAAAAIGGGLGLLSAKEQNKAQKQATQWSQEEARRMAQPRVWGPGEQYARGLLGEAGQLYRQQAFAPPPHEYTLQGRQGLLNYAQGRLPELTGAAQRSWQQGLQPELNPFLEGMIGAAQRGLRQSYARDIMPRIADQAQATGGFGGSRQGVAEGIASEGLLNAMGDVEAKMRGDAYDQALQHQRAAWGVAPQMGLLGYMAPQALMDVGRLYEGDAARQARNLQTYANLIGPYTGVFQGGGTVIPYGGASADPLNPWTAGLQGAQTGLGIYNMWNQSGLGGGGGGGTTSPLLSAHQTGSFGS